MAGFVWRLTRGRGAKQFSLAVCGVLAVVIAFLGKAEASIFDNARATLSDWTGPGLTQLRAPLLAVEQWIDNIGTIFTVYRENIQLRQENAELQKWQNVALALENRMQRYELLLHAVPDPRLASITARHAAEAQDRKSTPSELQSRSDLVCRLLLEKKKKCARPSEPSGAGGLRRARSDWRSGYRLGTHGATTAPAARSRTHAEPRLIRDSPRRPLG